MSPVLPRESEVWLSWRSVASLGICSEQWAAEKQRFQLDVVQLIVCYIFTQTQAVRWMRQNGNIAKATAYSGFWV